MKTRRSDEKVRTGKKAALISLIIYAAVLLLVPACAAEASAPGLSVRMNGSEAYDEFCRGLLRAAAQTPGRAQLLLGSAVCCGPLALCIFLDRTVVLNLLDILLASLVSA